MTDATTTTAEVEFHPTGTASTNAERQRRYRQRNAKRNALTVTAPVTRNVTSAGDVMVLCDRQDKIEITFNDDGDAILTQSSWPDEDHIIIVSHDNIETFIDKLTDALGIPSFGRSG
jgi:hypothetical protein